MNSRNRLFTGALLDELEQLATDELGGSVKRPNLTPIYTARRR